MLGSYYLRRHQRLSFFLLLIGLLTLTIVSIELLGFWEWTASFPNHIGSRETQAGFPRRLQNSIGQTLVIAQRPHRIVSQTLATDEILLAICPVAQIQALSVLASNVDYSNVVTPAAQIKERAVSIEHILGLEPDLIFVASYSRAEVAELLQATGAPVLRLTQFRQVADIKNNIRQIGYAIGEEEQAERLVAHMEYDIRTALSRIPLKVQQPHVLFYDQWGYTAGKNTLFDDMLRMIKGINLAAENGIEGHAQLNSEFIIKWQPDFIVAYAKNGEFAQVRRILSQNPIIAVSSVGQPDHRIIIVDSRYLTAASQYIVHAIRALVEGLYH